MVAESVVERLERAADRDAARWAAHDVARVAVDDAVVVTPGSAAWVVAAVRRLIEDGTPWRADAFAVLIYVLDHNRVYRELRAETRTYRGQWKFGIDEEEAVERALNGFDTVVRNMLDDLDPETRSLAAVLLARISSEPDADRELMLMLAEADSNERVRATLMGAPREWRWPAEEF
ncbi:hypothetical protein [Actinoplanes solisilvae]|uniref:hypothetical protein n=1 Tax=Actinoplanes solisilvae TaxID=2486853 RepID=UPI000FDA2416|nr:hypothetical protein [Actinoplanes solisilvae]